MVCLCLFALVWKAEVSAKAEIERILKTLGIHNMVKSQLTAD